MVLNYAGGPSATTWGKCGGRQLWRRRGDKDEPGRVHRADERGGLYSWRGDGFSPEGVHPTCTLVLSQGDLFQTSKFPNCKIIHLCCLKPQSLWSFFNSGHGKLMTC